MRVKLVKSLPKFSDHECCKVPAVGIWRVDDKHKWQYLCADCLAGRLDLGIGFFKEVFDV